MEDWSAIPLQYNVSLLCTVYTYTAFIILDFSMVLNRIGGVMVSVLASSALDRGFESQSGQTIASLRSKSKDWLAWIQDNVSDMSICRLLFQ